MAIDCGIAVRMDRLLTMRTFVTVVRLSSFSQAADELGISRTLTSRHIADLERHLGTKLLHRTTRAVTPTSAGYDYAAICRRVLDELETGEAEIAASRNEVVGEIAILCPIWLGSFGLSEAAAQFGVLHPRVDLRIQFEELSGNPHEFLDRQFDLCIQPTNMRDSDIRIRKIGDVDFCLIASPAYLARQGEPETVEALAQHSLLVKTGESDWQFANGARFPARTTARMSTNSVFALCSAATEGLGIALVPRSVAERFPVKLLLSETPPTSRPLFVAMAPGKDVPMKVRKFVEFLADWFRRQAQ